MSFLILTVVDCGPLTDPVNGAVDTSSGTTYQETATYTCDPGYTLRGNATRTCQLTGRTTGAWSSSAPYCEGELSSLLVPIEPFTSFLPTQNCVL